MGTSVYYNGVLMRNCQTRQFEQTIERDESNSDVWNSKFRIAVESSITGFWFGPFGHHPITIATAEGPQGAGTLADRMEIVRKRLSEARKDFLYTMDAQTPEDGLGIAFEQVLLAASFYDANNSYRQSAFIQDFNGNDLVLKLAGPNGHTDAKIERKNVADANNGPFPQNVQLHSIMGGRGARVSFEIEVCRQLCTVKPDTDDSSFPPDPYLPELANGTGDVKPDPHVLSNKWSIEETCDENFVRGRVISGTLRLRHQAYWPHAYRWLCVPAPLKGYKRTGMTFVTDPTDLNLRYRIEDRQQQAAAPFPAVNWTMREASMAQNDALGAARRRISLVLTGKPGEDRTHLYDLAIRIIELRFPKMFEIGLPIAAANSRDFMREEFVVVTEQNSPTVEVNAAIRYLDETAASFVFGILNQMQDLQEAGLGEGYDVEKWEVPEPFDRETPLGLFGCYLQSPCSQYHGIPRNLYGFASSVEPNDIPDYNAADNGYRQFSVPGEITDDPVQIFSNEHRAYNYTEVEIDTEYANSSGIISLPLSVNRGGFSNPETMATCRVHAGTCQRVLTVRATREGVPPVLPTPVSTLTDYAGNVETLLADKSVIDAPEARGDQQSKVYSVQAKFVYAMKRAHQPGDRLMVASSPALNTTPNSDSITYDTLFQTGIIEKA